MIMEKPFKVNKAANVRNLDDIRFPEDDIDNKF